MPKCNYCKFKESQLSCITENNHEVCELAFKEGNECFVNFITQESIKLHQHTSPNIAKKAANLAVAVVKHAADGFKHVDNEYLAERLNICNQCEHQSIDGKRECLICGCYVEIKAKLRSEKCPLGYWSAHPEKKEQQISQTIITPEPEEIVNTQNQIQYKPKSNGGCGCA